jgi:succinyl-CoA synthetase alpha subunit
MKPGFVTPDTRVLIQGATGRAGRRHAVLMRNYGTNVVAGVSPSSTEPIEGIPVFGSCAEAVAATGATATVVIVRPLEVLGAVKEALAAGLDLIVTVAEGVPVADSIAALELVRDADATWIGPSTPGIAIPGRLKMGFLPSVSLLPGPLGLMSKSGTLSYEIGYRLAGRGVGTSLWVGVGGDMVKGTRFADLIPVFEEDADTEAMLLIGEVGGTEEEDFAKAYRDHGARKPVYAIVAGAQTREGIAMGHAGALVHGASGTIEAKTAALSSVGAQVFTRIRDFVDAVGADFGKPRLRSV